MKSGLEFESISILAMMGDKKKDGGPLLRKLIVKRKGPSRRRKGADGGKKSKAHSEEKNKELLPSRWWRKGRGEVSPQHGGECGGLTLVFS